MSELTKKDKAKAMRNGQLKMERESKKNRRTVLCGGFSMDYFMDDVLV